MSWDTPSKKLRRWPTANEVAHFRRALLRWGRKHYRRFPWRSERNQFHALIAECLLQRTRAEQVRSVYLMFRKRFPTPESLAKAKTREIYTTIRPLGLAWRARFLKRLGKMISERGVSKTFAELTQLPGIGPYAAAAFLSLHASIRALIIDANVVRLYGRCFGFETGPETRRKKWLWQLAERLTPKRAYRAHNYALLDLCANVCNRSPKCLLCALRICCRYGVSDCSI